MIEHYPASVAYDTEVNAWYIDLRNPLSQKNVSRTAVRSRTVNFDYGMKGDLLGIEIL